MEKTQSEHSGGYIYKLLRQSEKYLKTDMVYLAESGLWINFNYIVGSFLSFIASIAFAYFVSKETYGTYKYILSAAGIFTALSLTGMNMAVVRATAQGFEGIFSRSLWEQFRWNIAQFATLCAIGIYYFYHGNLLFGWSFVAISLLSPISSIANTYNAYLTGKKDFKTMSLYGIFSNIFNFLAIVGAIIFSQNLLVLILVFHAARMLLNVFLCWRTFKKYKPNSLFRIEDFTYAKHMSAMNMLGEVAANIENVIVFQMLGPVSVSLYTFALAVPDRLKSLFNFVGTAALAKMSSKEDLEIGKNISHKIIILIVLGLSIALCYVLAAPALFSIFFPKYMQSILFSQIYVVSMVTIAASIPVSALYAKKLQRELYVLNIASPIIKILVFVLGTYCFGLLGAVISKVFYSFVQVLMPTKLLFDTVQKEKIV